MDASNGGSKPTPYPNARLICKQLVEDQYSLLPNYGLPLWAFLYTISGLIYVFGLIVVSCKYTTRENSPPARRVFSVAYWVVSIALLAMGIIHFSAAFDQALLMVTKTVMTICIHSVIFGSQVSIICFYFVSEHLIWPLHTKVLKTMVPTAILSVTFGVMEASFVGLHWTNTVLKSGTGALTTFWVIVKAFLVLAYATTFLVGLIPWKNLHFPSPSVLDYHVLIMLSIQIVELIGRVGTYRYTDASPFGCAAAIGFLLEYIIFVPSIFICAAWLFRVRSPIGYSILPETSDTTDPPPAQRRRMTKGVDSEFAIMSSDYDTDRY